MTNTMNAPWFSIIKTLASQLPPMGGYLTGNKEIQDIQIKIQAAKDRYNKQIADKQAYIRNLKQGGAAYNREKPELDRLIRNKNAQMQPLLAQLRAARFRASQQQKPSPQQTSSLMQNLRRTQGNLSPQQQLQPTQPQTQTQYNDPKIADTMGMFGEVQRRKKERLPQQPQPTQPRTQTQPQITNVGGGQAGLQNPLQMKKPPQQTLAPEQQASIRAQMDKIRRLMASSKDLPDGGKTSKKYEDELNRLKDRLKSSGIPA